MNVAYIQGSYIVTTPNTTFRLSGEELVVLLAYFNFTPHYDSPEQLGTIAQLVLTNHIPWFEEWDDLDSFALYTPEDWGFLRDICHPPTLHVSFSGN